MNTTGKQFEHSHIINLQLNSALLEFRLNCESGMPHLHAVTCSTAVMAAAGENKSTINAPFASCLLGCFQQCALLSTELVRGSCWVRYSSILPGHVRKGFLQIPSPSSSLHWFRL